MTSEEFDAMWKVLAVRLHALSVYKGRRRMRKRQAYKILGRYTSLPLSEKGPYTSEQVGAAYKTILRRANKQKKLEWEALSPEEQKERKQEAILALATPVIGPLLQYLTTEK